MPWLSLVLCAFWLPPAAKPLWVDRMEGEWVVLMDQDEATAEAPRFCLPADVRPGDVVVNGLVDPVATQRGWTTIRKLTGGTE